MKKWVEVFKPGIYPQGKVTNKDLEELVANYDIKFFQSPVTLDHKEEGPIYGKVESVKFEDNKLFVKFDYLTSEMETLIKDGKYSERSIEIYPNLEGKGKYLKAVSFVPFPQVKGLAPMTFSEKSQSKFEFPKGEFLKFSDDNRKFNSISYVFRGIRDWFIENFGLDTANKVVTDYDIDILKQKEDDWTFKEQNKNKNNEEDKVNESEIREKVKKEIEEQHKKELLKFQEETNSLLKFKEETELANFNTRFDNLVATGRITPGHKDNFLSAWKQGKNQVMKFSDKETLDLGEYLLKFAESLPEKIFANVGDNSKYSKSTAKDDLNISFSENYDSLDKRVMKFAESHNVSYEEALNKVMEGEI